MSYPGDRVFTIVGQPFSGTELFLAADVFTVEWRVMENTAIPQHQPLVHHKPFAPRHYVAG
jgi:hypothetical protein